MTRARQPHHAAADVGPCRSNGPRLRPATPSGAAHGAGSSSHWNAAPPLTRALAEKARSERAEGVGFEPTVGRTHNGFRDRPIRPLSHPSEDQASGRGRRAEKNEARSSAHSSARTPWVTGTSWFSLGSEHRL